MGALLLHSLSKVKVEFTPSKTHIFFTSPLTKQSSSYRYCCWYYCPPHYFKYVLDPASMHLTHDMPLTKLYSSQDSTFFSLLLKEKRHHDISCIVSSLSVLFPKAKAGSISISLVVWWSVFAQYSV